MGEAIIEIGRVDIGQSKFRLISKNGIVMYESKGYCNNQNAEKSYLALKEIFLNAKVVYK